MCVCVVCFGGESKGDSLRLSCLKVVRNRVLKRAGRVITTLKEEETFAS